MESRKFEVASSGSVPARASRRFEMPSPSESRRGFSEPVWKKVSQTSEKPLPLRSEVEVGGLVKKWGLLEARSGLVNLPLIHF